MSTQRYLQMAAAGTLYLAAATGCGAQTMSVPQDVVKSSQELQVADRSSWSGALADESFKLGPYEVADVDRDWNSGSGFGVSGFSSEHIAGGYSFQLKEAGAAMKGVCATEQTDKSLSLGSGMSLGKQTAKVACTCGDDADVLLQTSTGDEYGGTLNTSGGGYQIKAIYERDGALSDGTPAGYRVDGEGPVGAVEVLKPGRAWIGKQIEGPERKQLACIFAGLMLYMPPKE